MKMFKRAAAFCAAVVMSLSVSATAFAAGNGGDRTLVVTGDTLDNKNVYAVQMFDARVEGETEDYTFDSYVLADDDWIPFFTSGTGEGGIGLTDQDSDDDVDTDDVRAYLEKLSDESTDIKTLADKAQAWVRNNSGNFTVLTATASDDRATFTDLKAGYYLVYPEGGSAGNGNRGTDAMLVNVPRDNNAVLNIKSTYPTVDKKVDTDNEGPGAAADNGSAQVGDVVTFTLTSAVPDMSDFTTYVFQFTDKLPEGLTLVNKNDNTAITQNTDFTVDDITLTINGNTVKAENVTVTLADGSDTDVGKKILTVKINNLKAENLLESESVVAGQQIVLTYKAMINENAVTTNPVTNEASVQYSNNPSEETLGTSTPDESTVYTYEIDVHKWSTENGGDSAYLKDAVFALSKESNLGTLSISEAEGDTNGKVVNDNGDSVESSLIGLTGSGNTYMIDPESTVYTFTTNGSAVIKVQGLEVGTYYLYEVNAPSGYNKLKEPVKISTLR